MTITPELIEQVARRMCELQGRDPDQCPIYEGGEAFHFHRWRQFIDRARDAIAAHIALAEIMPPDRATLLAVADAAIGNSSSEAGVVWQIFANALRAKAGGGE